MEPAVWSETLTNNGLLNYGQLGCGASGRSHLEFPLPNTSTNETRRLGQESCMWTSVRVAKTSGNVPVHGQSGSSIPNPPPFPLANRSALAHGPGHLFRWKPIPGTQFTTIPTSYNGSAPTTRLTPNLAVYARYANREIRPTAATNLRPGCPHLGLFRVRRTRRLAMGWVASVTAFFGPRFNDAKTIRSFNPNEPRGAGQLHGQYDHTNGGSELDAKLSPHVRSDERLFRSNVGAVLPKQPKLSNVFIGTFPQTAQNCQ